MPGWLKDAVFYEIYPQSFKDTNGDGIGDINGIIEKLDYVVSLGCNALWINPCFDSPFKDAGYDVRDYRKVAPRYGTNEDLYKLFEEAHKKGILDIFDYLDLNLSLNQKFQQALDVLSQCSQGLASMRTRAPLTVKCLQCAHSRPARIPQYAGSRAGFRAAGSPWPFLYCAAGSAHPGM